VTRRRVFITFAAGLLPLAVGACASEASPGAGGGGVASGGVSGSVASGGVSGGSAGASGSGASGGSPASGGVGAGGSAGATSGSGGAGASSGSGGAGGGAGSGSAAGAGGSGTGGAGGSGEVGVRIDGPRILVDGVPFHIQGVCWNPVPKGGVHPADLDFAAAAAVDVPLMAAAGINAVRTYEPLTDRGVLDALHAAGIYVLNTVYPYGGNEPSSAAAAVESVRDHPANLMWVIGNEWNYNGLYVGLSHEASIERLNQVAAAIRAVDTTRPISTVYGELPSVETLAAMPEIDVWGLNVYRGIGFGTLFSDWAARSSKPFYLSEYGADAWNALSGAEDTQSQADAVGALTELILDNASAFSTTGTCAGGTVFEWADEWWKDDSGSPDAQDIGGVAPGGGPHPDQTFNEEWWGIVDIDRNPRPAYRELERIFSP